MKKLFAQLCFLSDRVQPAERTRFSEAKAHELPGSWIKHALKSGEDILRMDCLSYVHMPKFVEIYF